MKESEAAVMKKGKEPDKRTIHTSNIVVKRSALARDGVAHSHDFFELSMCMSGHVLHKINGNCYDFLPGDVVLLTPTDFHSETVYEYTETIQIHFKENMLEEEIVNRILDYGSEMVFRFDEETKAAIRSIMLLLLNEYEANGEYKNEYLKRLFGCLMIVFLRSSRIGADRKKSFSPMEKAMMYLHAHVRENPTLEEVAAVAGMSSSHYSREFSRCVGRSFRDYLLLTRINAAEKLLLLTDMSVTEIALASGFATSSHFIERFKRLRGMTPSKYRQTWVKN